MKCRRVGDANERETPYRLLAVCVLKTVRTRIRNNLRAVNKREEMKGLGQAESRMNVLSQQAGIKLGSWFVLSLNVV